MIFIKDKLPLVSMDEESIMQSIGLVLKQANVVRFNVDSRTGMIDFWRIPTEQDLETLDVVHPFRVKLKEVQMEEYDPDDGLTSHEQLFQMCEMIEDAGCFPVFFLSGRTLVNLRKWISFPRRSSSLVGIPISVDADLMEDTFLVCGSKVRDAEPIDVSYVVKMTLP